MARIGLWWNRFFWYGYNIEINEIKVKLVALNGQCETDEKKRELQHTIDSNVFTIKCIVFQAEHLRN